jgi:carboxyl-terminal processing protease
MNPGDIITSVDGRPVKDRFLPDAIDDMEGDPGVMIRLTVLPPDGEEREIELEREYILLPTLDFEMLDRSYGYFRLTQFHRDSAKHLQEALESIAADGTELRGLVIDLRDNPGGVLQPAVEIADGFLDEGLIVSTRGRNASMQMEFSAHEGQWLAGVPLVLLVDRGSASASEVLAGALQDHGRALVVGERTFGKGSVQSVLPLRNGGGIKLTTAHYYTPSGRSIQAEGILPDVVADAYGEMGDDDRSRESDLEGHLGRPDDTDNGVKDPSRPVMEFPVDEIMEVLKAAELIGTAEDMGSG